MTNFLPSDLEQLRQAGISESQAQEQLARFKQGTPFVNLARPATLGDGIYAISEDQVGRLSARYEEAQAQGRVTKFVPASGAATRMFKDLFELKESLADSAPGKTSGPHAFFDHLPQFAFFAELRDVLSQKGIDTQQPISAWPKLDVLAALLDPEGLSYGQKPKALLTFHRHGDKTRTAAEEHFEEALAFCLDAQGTARIHFSVSPEHLQEFRERVSHANDALAPQGQKLDVSFSIQKPSTDTLAGQVDGTPFRDSKGRLVLRPGGHGALIENLNELGGDIVILKNIDNVVPAEKMASTLLYKKLLGGLLLDIQDRMKAYLEQLKAGDLPPRSQVFHFIQTYLGCRLNFEQRFSDSQLHQFLKDLFHRPLRVCGMVRNQGEPGGGPFWVKQKDGRELLQIIESSQIATHQPEQKEILIQSTHFNPVDLVCSVRDFDGNPFNLTDYIDHETYFLSSKSQNGKPLLALERPGLWNGAMAFWNTLFVEVPLNTFNPVKTVMDLLRPNHRS